MPRILLTYRRWLYLTIAISLLIVPFHIYIEESIHLELLLLAALIFTLITYAEIYLALNTAYVPLWRMSGNPDLLVLANIDPATVRRSIWSAFMSGNRWLTLGSLVIVRLTAAIGMSHRLHIDHRFFWPLYDNLPLRYVSHNFKYPWYSDWEYWWPVWWQYGLAIIVLMIFAVLEARLLIALGSTVNSIRNLAARWRPISFVMLRVGTVLISFICVLGLGAARPYVQPTIWATGDLSCIGKNGVIDPLEVASYWGVSDPIGWCRDNFMRHQSRRIIEAGQFAVTGLMDGALLHAANLMRPNLSRHFHTDSLIYAPGAKWSEPRNGWSNSSFGYLGVRWNITAWGYVARMILSVLISALLYTALTDILFRRSRYSIRRSAD